MSAHLPAGHAPTEAPAEVRAETGAVALPVPAPAKPVRTRTGLIAGAVIGFIVVGISLLLVAIYFLLALGPGLTLVGGFLALVPLTIVLLGVRWIDRWEPEPRLILLFAFLWGATVSVLLALFVDSGIQQVIAASGGPTDATVVLQTAVQAPIVEEIGKGIGVLLIFLFARNYFDGPVDGITYAAVVAGGFAFTENIQYFGIELANSGLGFEVGFIFVLRGLMSPFAHVMFTMFTGLLIGLAARNGSRLLGTGAFFVGVIPAILLHALWNGALFVVSDFFSYYFIVQVPLFIGALVLVVLLRRREVKLTQQRLGEYAAAGWLNPGEVTSLATPAGRRNAVAWAGRYNLRKLMKGYIKDATALAFARQRILSGRDLIGSQADEATLLGRLTDARRTLSAATAAPAAGVAPAAGPALPPPPGTPPTVAG